MDRSYSVEIGTAAMDPATKDQLAQWFDEGVAQKADYMIIVTDTFELTDSPVYVTNGGEKTVHEIAQSYEDDQKMTRVMEVYDLHGDRDVQVAEQRTWAIPKPNPSEMTALVEALLEVLTTPPDENEDERMLVLSGYDGRPN